MSALDRLVRALDYEFQDPALLTLALTHRSVSSQNNERLEFLGDAVLGGIIAAELFLRFPQASEGQLTRLRASLVKGDTLAKIGRELALGEYLSLGSGELKSGGHRRGSILACALEAIIGAVWLDGGDAAARRLVLRLYAARLDEVSPEAAHKDPKTRLQEYMQARKLPLPVYELLSVEGEDHQQTFRVRCRVAGAAGAVEGCGSSRRKAEQDAARQAFERIAVQQSKRS